MQKNFLITKSWNKVRMRIKRDKVGAYVKPFTGEYFLFGAIPHIYLPML
jgi:hypothetical protein